MAESSFTCFFARCNLKVGGRRVFRVFVYVRVARVEAWTILITRGTFLTDFKIGKERILNPLRPNWTEINFAAACPKKNGANEKVRLISNSTKFLDLMMKMRKKCCDSLLMIPTD
ncbi:unnamed protein product [Cercopithifilaria johnstoni]|uniref:Uncharacterized protein n=1 Tax=Cercopithifilaria johnstoni TaxID=2874296 RepID=A0A8J2LZI0_9BILA|nr:unnamed protein product [Cercopithifilaria johnstoni]